MSSKTSRRSLTALLFLLLAVTLSMVIVTKRQATRPTTGASEPGGQNDQPLSDIEINRIMQALIEGNREDSDSAIDRILEAGDRRFISVLIELLRGWQIGVTPNVDIVNVTKTLEFLSGQTFGNNWFAWIEWYGNSELVPPPGFTGWKGQMLSKIDPGFAEFLLDDVPSRIRVEEIQWGGVSVDGIPALDNPAMLAAEEAGYLNPEDPVFGIAVNGDARAYPLRILDWHEMANDVVGGLPVSLAYCTLCGAAIAYDGRLDDRTLTFGSSGFLFRSNKLMYDRQTRTLWNQLTGEPVLGTLAAENIRLNLLPVVLTSWHDWREQHPDTLVLDINTGYTRNYALGAAYGHYFASAETMFPVAQRSSLLDTKAQIYALRVEGTPIAYPLDILIAEQVINDTVAGINIVLIAPRDKILVRGFSQAAGTVSYAAGGEVRAYLRGDRRFTFDSGQEHLLDSSGGVWQISEEALEGPQGEQAPRLAGHLAYWFGWYAFFPNTLVYGQ